MIRFRWIKVLIVMLFICCLLPSTLPAEQDKGLEGLELLRRTFVGVDDFTADISQEKQLALMKQKMISRGILRFKKPGIFFMELYPPYASKVLLKGNNLTVRFPAEGTKEQIVLAPEESLERWVSYLADPIKALPEGVEFRSIQYTGGYTMQLFPKGKGVVKRMDVACKSDGTLRRITIVERNNDQTVISFKRIRKNLGLTDDYFRIE